MEYDVSSTSNILGLTSVLSQEVEKAVFRLFIIAFVIGILFALGILFSVPTLISEARMVSAVAEFLLKLSNTYFDTMPSLMARYLASLNLGVIALSGGLIVTIIVYLLMVSITLVISLSRLVARVFKREKKVEKVDLPPVELDPGIDRQSRMNKVLGRGFDTIDRD